MAIFCTKCGTNNEDGAAFCDNCGSPLRSPVAAAKPPASGAASTAIPGSAQSAEHPKSKKILYAGAALALVLLAGGGALYFGLQPPSASPSNLLAAARAGYGDAVSQQYKKELCFENMNYSEAKFNTGEYDRRTQAWLNALVAAGLYSPPVTVMSSGFFANNLLQYVATPELAKYREGTQLCLAKNVELSDVVDIQTPAEESLGRNGGPPKVLAVKAKLTFIANNAAPWLEKQEVRDVVLAEIRGWGYKDNKLHKQVVESFGLREGKWATGPVYKAELAKQYKLAQRGNNGENSVDNAKTGGVFSRLSSALSGLFSFGGHPLKGTWRLDTEGMGRSMGFGLPSGLGLDTTMKFTSDSIDVGAQSVKCKFEVEGDRVKVIPEGQAASLIFVMEDKDTAMLDLGLMQMRYTRVN